MPPTGLHRTPRPRRRRLGRVNAARRTATFFVVLAVLALAAAGCGVKAKDGGSGGTDGGTTETTAPSETTTAPSEDTTETTEDSTDTTEDTTDTTEDTGDTTIPDFGDFGQEDLVKLYTDMGLSEEQATCLVDTIFSEAAGGTIDPNDQSAIFDYLAACDIDITDFGGMGSGG